MREPFNDKEFLMHGEWETCCVKKRPTGDEKPDFMGYAAFGVLVSPKPPILVFLRGEDGVTDFTEVKEYADVDAMLADGWIVD